MKIVSSQDLRVTTLGGTAVLFQAGVPREIADEIGLLAIQMGAKEYNDKYVEEEKAEIAEFEEVAIETAQPDEDLVTCLEKMMDEGDPLCQTIFWQSSLLIHFIFWVTRLFGLRLHAIATLHGRHPSDSRYV